MVFLVLNGARPNEPRQMALPNDGGAVEIFARDGKQMLSSNPMSFPKTWKRDIRVGIPLSLWLPTGVSGLPPSLRGPKAGNCSHPAGPSSKARRAEKGPNSKRHG